MAAAQQQVVGGVGLPSAGEGLLQPAQPTVATVSGNIQKFAMKKKKLLNAEEVELYELTQAAGITIDQEAFKIILDLLKMNVAPLAVFQMLKSMCAGHRITEPSAAGNITNPAQYVLMDPRGRNKPNPVGGGSQAQTERSNREGGSQRIPRQSSASRLQKGAVAGKSN